MIRVVARNHIKNDKLKEAVKLSMSLVETSRQEEGCLSYDLCQDTNDSQILTMIEEWFSKEALENHLRSDHVRDVFKKVEPLLEKETEIHVYHKVY
ncbi:antibiotic biosynthesis monooxygenase [Acidaminobacter sp. JC074]|uniref:putative quinol monooxygenase n=1 Tax=Acidaminobacter sp. JC074 TaxID=2530199 RepID=UPI001F10C181|nr:putative quinol monooxygenase [Acidaminobacter sp. JC074]MCH4889222.1 antibiotic biosynthesis monooxygenase [Acidaminobacter sp. JC074]